MAKTIDVCLSPDMMHLYDVSNKTVVVVDILRATSCMVTAFAFNVDHIVPFADLDSCRQMAHQGYITSGERNGEKVEGFHKGNSPFEYMEEIRGKKIAFTTTNGTQAIEKAKGAPELIIGAFLNLTAVANHVMQGNRDVLVVCAGWKGKVNLEDSLFAGALVEKVKSQIEPGCDAPIMAQHLYQLAGANKVDFLKNASHMKRLNRLGIKEDIQYCLTEDRYQVVPQLRDGALRA